MTPTNRRKAEIAVAMTAISHERRVRLLCLLSAERGGISFEDLLAKSGMRLSTLTHHLRPMRAAGLIATQRKGHRVLYRLETAALERAMADVAAAITASAPLQKAA